MKKLCFILTALLCCGMLNAASFFGSGDLFNRPIEVTKGDYAFMQDDAKMWLDLDFTKAQLIIYHCNKKQTVKEETGRLFIADKTEEEWAKEFDAIYFWIIKIWNRACDKRHIPLHMTADKDSAKYAMEFIVNIVDYGFPGGFVMERGATIGGTIVVRDLATGETVYEAVADRIRAEFSPPPTEVTRIRQTLLGGIFAPHFLGMDPWYIDVSDDAKLMKYNKNYKSKKK